jgi:two-component system, cell cycle sensor histidine kinase and response regulator CckA
VVLLVDDEATILAFTAFVLRRAGHLVLTASSPGEALGLLFAQSSLIDLVITDVEMPGLRGPEMIHRLSNLPYIPRVIYMSADELPLESRERAATNRLLLKPFTIAGLIDTVAEALSERKAAE